LSSKYTTIFTKINASAGRGSFTFDEEYEYISIDKKLLDTLYKSNNANTIGIKRNGRLYGAYTA